MARRPAQFGTAKVKERDAGRPLLVILLLVAVGIAVFLWLLPDSDPVTPTGPLDEPEPTTSVEAEAEPSATRDEPDAGRWWSRIEGTIYDAFRAAEARDCDSLAYAVEDLAAADTRREPALAAAYRGLVSNFETAAATCESNPQMLQGTVTSASRRLESLIDAGRRHGVEASSILDEYR